MRYEWIGTLSMMLTCAAWGLPPPAYSDACLGNSYIACVNILKPIVEVGEDDDLDLAIGYANEHHPDPDGGYSLSPDFSFRGFRGEFSVVFVADAGQTITSAVFKLPANPATAATLADFDATGAYRVVLLAMGQHCADLASEEAFFDYFARNVWPSVRRTDNRPNLKIEMDGVDYTDQTPELDLCGRKFSLRAEYGGIHFFQGAPPTAVGNYTAAWLTLK